MTAEEKTKRPPRAADRVFSSGCPMRKLCNARQAVDLLRSSTDYISSLVTTFVFAKLDALSRP